MQLINFPSRHISPQVPQQQTRGLNLSAENNRVRFVFDAPLGNEQSADTRNYLHSTPLDDAATSAENFHLLLKEQQQTTANANPTRLGPFPFDDAIAAYTAGENTAYYAQPRGTYLATL